MSMCDCGECEDCLRATLINERDRRLAAEDRESTLRSRLAEAERERDRWKSAREHDAEENSMVRDVLARVNSDLAAERAAHEADKAELSKAFTAGMEMRHRAEQAEAALGRARELLTFWNGAASNFFSGRAPYGFVEARRDTDAFLATHNTTNPPPEDPTP